MKEFLITLPEHDERTHICSALNKEVVIAARKRGMNVFALRKDRANRKNVRGILTKRNPRLVVFNGHGDEETICGHNDEPLIKAGKNEGLLKSKIVYTIACNSAKKLGPACIKKKTESYIGYKEVFAWYTDSYARSIEKDRFANAIFAPSNAIPITLIKGHLVSEAFAKSKEVAEKNILEFKLHKEGMPEAPIVLQILLWNKTNQTLLGDPDARV